MLIQFSTQNYMSIRERVDLSLEPTNDSAHPESITEKGNQKALNAALIYGANASGKSNLFKAMTAAINYIRMSNSFQPGTRIPVVPFKLDEESANSPTMFEFVFVADDGQKYIYGFSAFPDRVVEEYLYVYHTNRPTMIFDRKNVREYKFSRQHKAQLSPFTKMNTDNKLFLATATTWNAESTKPAFTWFQSRIDTYSEEALPNEHFALEAYRLDENKENQKFTLELLKQSDINIISMDVKAKKIEKTAATLGGINGIVVNGQIIIPNNQEQYEMKITTGHEVDGKRYMLSLDEESLGTKNLFFYGPMLKKTLDEGKVMFLDEIENSLHPAIVRYIVGMFGNPEINKNGAQLISTTHETSLMNLKMLRKDQYYFTEKDENTAVTRLYSLSDYSVRRKENIEKGYLLGRYGAVPLMGTAEVD